MDTVQQPRLTFVFIEIQLSTTGENMINERIRRARLLRGLSLQALADGIGDISKQALSKYETGDAVPNSARLLQLARLLNVKPEYFFRTESVELAPLEFRKLAKMPKYRQAQVEELMRDLLERYLALERCFDVEEVAVRPPEPGMFVVNSPEQAEEAAVELRAEWGLGSDAIANLTEVLEDHGIKIFLLSGPDDFDGACAASTDNEHVIIALNEQRPGERMRFTAAHELGHWVMQIGEGMSERDKENCCHRFAGAFLYPADQVRSEFGSHIRSRVHPGELLNAKRRYGISMQGALRRLKDLDLLRDRGFTQMSILFSTRGWRKSEPEPLDSEQPRRFESLVYRGLAEELFTPSRASELLLRPIDSLNPALLGEVEGQ